MVSSANRAEEGKNVTGRQCAREQYQVAQSRVGGGAFLGAKWLPCSGWARVRRIRQGED